MDIGREVDKRDRERSAQMIEGEREEKKAERGKGKEMKEERITGA